MSVTFKRTQLITVARTALREHERLITEHQQAIAAYKAKSAERNTENTRARAHELRNAITKALRKGGPVYAKDLMPALGGSDYLGRHFYISPRDSDIRSYVPMPSGMLKPAEVDETRALIQVLQAATGDTISVNELKLLGLKNLQPVFIAAGRS